MNVKPSSLQKMAIRNKKCSVYLKKSKVPNLGKGFSLTQGILDKNITFEHWCHNESVCTQTLPKKISSGDLTDLSVIYLSDSKFSDKLNILTDNMP